MDSLVNKHNFNMNNEYNLITVCFATFFLQLKLVLYMIPLLLAASLWTSTLFLFAVFPYLQSLFLFVLLLRRFEPLQLISFAEFQRLAARRLKMHWLMLHLLLCNILMLIISRNVSLSWKNLLEIQATNQQIKCLFQNITC